MSIYIFKKANIFNEINIKCSILIEKGSSHIRLINAF